MTSTEVAVKDPQGEVLVQQAPTQQVSASDILIPSILINQPTSDFGEEIKQGHIVRSTDKVDLGKDVEVIPLSFYKTWTVFDLSGSKPQWKRSEPCDYSNENLPWEFTEDGVPLRRDLCLNFYCLVPQDIKREHAAMSSDDPDPDDMLLPILLRFTRTSYKIGKQLVTHFAKIERFKQRNPNVNPYGKVFKLTTELMSGDSGKYYVWDVVGTEKVDPSMTPSCVEWASTIASTDVKVHEVDEEVPQAKGVDVSDFDV